MGEPVDPIGKIEIDFNQRAQSVNKPDFNYNFSIFLFPENLIKKEQPFRAALLPTSAAIGSRKCDCNFYLGLS